MKINAADFRNLDGSTFNAKNDPRLMKIGSVLRATSIDELPQVLNVLLGHMSFVGPRPDIKDHMLKYTKEESRKLTVLPGITGYNQAYFRNSIPLPGRLVNDAYYVDNYSSILDIKILIATFSSIIFKKNICN